MTMRGRSSGQSTSDFDRKIKAEATDDFTYTSISPLYTKSELDVFGEQLTFAVGCSKNPPPGDKYQVCYVHKLEVEPRPSFKEAKMRVTHEVKPTFRHCSNMLKVSEKLVVAAMDENIVSISNFGPGKTFNCDVRGALKNHSNDVTSIATNFKGQLASSSENEIGLYQITGDRLNVGQKRNVSGPVVGIEYDTSDKDPSNIGTDSIFYCTTQGYCAVLDTRCHDAEESQLSTEIQNRRVSGCCLIGNKIFVGAEDGSIVCLDTRHLSQSLDQRVSTGRISRLRKIVVQDNKGREITSIGLVSGLNEVEIIQQTNLEPQGGWSCDRHSDGIVTDFCQLDDRIITCGTDGSIGCWSWTPDA